MATNPSQFRDLENALNRLGSGYRVYEEPNTPDRVVIERGKNRINLSLQLSLDRGPAGRTWMIPSDNGSQITVIRPELTGTYMRNTGNVTWSAATSTEQLATMIHKSGIKTRALTSDWADEFQRTLSQGDSDFGFQPSPSFSPSAPAILRQRLQSLGLNIKSSGGKSMSDVETRAVLQSLRQNINQGSGSPVRPSKIGMSENVGDFSERFTFKDLSAYHMQPDTTGLVPTVPTGMPDYVQRFGVWRGQDPIRRAKSQTLWRGQDQVLPYENVPGQGYRPMQAGFTTGGLRPNWAYSNVLFSGEYEPAQMERRRVIFDRSPIAGAAFAYEDRQGVTPAFWGKESNKVAPVGNLSILDIINGDVKLNLDKNVISRPMGGANPVETIGTLQRGAGKPEDIKMQTGPAMFRANSVGFNVPRWFNATTGMPATYSKEDIKNDTIREVDEETRVALQERLGVPVNVVNGTKMGITMSGSIQAGSSLKAAVKVTEALLGKPFNIDVGGQSRSVSHLMSDLKDPSIALYWMGGMDYKQLHNLLSDYSGKDSKLVKYFEGKYKKASRSGLGLNVDFDRLAKYYQKTSGADIHSGLELGADIFNKTILSQTAGSEANTRNLNLYNAGRIEKGTMIPLGVWHNETLAGLKSSQIRAYEQKLGRKLSTKESEEYWNKNFQVEPGPKGYSNVYQPASENAVYMETLLQRRIENVHGASAGWEVLSGVSEQFPEFARQLGFHIENYKPRGKTQKSAMGILKYLAFQGQRDEASFSGSGMNMPSKYTPISNETIQNISSYLEQSRGDKTPIEQLEHISKTYLKNISNDDILYNERLNTFIPNPRAILGSTYESLGVTAASYARPYLKMLGALGDILNPFMEYTPQQQQEAAIKAQAGFMAYTKRMVAGEQGLGGGNFFKHLLSRIIPSAYGGRDFPDPSLGPEEQYLSKDILRSVAGRMGLSGKEAWQFVNRISREGGQFIETRFPQLMQASFLGGHIQTENIRKHALGEEAYENIEADPRNVGRIGVSLAWGQAHAGDWDADPVYGILGFVRNRKTGEIKQINDPEIEKNLLTNERAALEEQRYFQNQQFRNTVNATVSQLGDYAKGKDVMGTIMHSIKDYKILEAVDAGLNTWQSKGLGMGIGYNPRRAVLGAMSVSGYSNEETQGVLSTIPSFYQPALDKLLGKDQAAGVPAASVIAKSYIARGKMYNPRTGENKERSYIKLSSGGVYSTRTNRMTPEGWILPEEKSPGAYLDAETFWKDQQQVMVGGSFLAEQFASSVPLSKGGNAELSAEQFARWFARPGEYEKLKKSLPKDRSMWSGVIQNYYRGILGELGTGHGIEAIARTPVWGSIITRIGSKAINRTDLRTGEGLVSGEEAGLNEFMSNAPSKYQEDITASQVVHDIAHRGRGTNLRGMTAERIRIAARGLPQGVLGSGMRAIANAIGIDISDNPERSAALAISYAQQLHQDKIERDYYRAVQNNQYSGTLDEFVTEVRNEEARLNAGIRGGNTSQPQNVENNNPEEVSPASTVPPTPPEPPVPPSPPSTPSAPPPDDNSGRRKRRNRNNRATSSTNTNASASPSDVQQLGALRARGLARRVGFEIRGNVNALTANTRDILPSLNEALTDIGFSGPEELGSVRERMEAAFRASPKKFMEAIPDWVHSELRSAKGYQQALGLVDALISQAPVAGYNKATYNNLLHARMNLDTPGMGQLIELGASYRNMTQGVSGKPSEFRNTAALANSPEFAVLYNQLKNDRLLNTQIGPEQTTKIKGIIAGNPAIQEALRRSSTLPGSSVEKYEDVSQVREVAKAFKAIEGSGSLSRKVSYDAAPTEEVQKLTEAMTKLKDITEKLHGSVGILTKKEEAELLTQEKMAKLGVAAARAGVGISGIKGRIAELTEKSMSGTPMSNVEKEELATLSGKEAKFETAQTRAEYESGQIAEEAEEGKWGGFARRMFGGFGLMYLRSITGIMTQNLGQGQAERITLENIIAQGKYTATGRPLIPYNQQQALQNQTALYGALYNPLTGIQQLEATNPAIRDVINTGISGAASWGFLKYMGKELKGTAGKTLSGAAIPIAVALTAAGTAGDIFARTQDPTGLGYRLSTDTGIKSPLDYIAAGAIQKWDKEGWKKFQISEAATKVIDNAFEKGLTIDQMMQTRVEGKRDELSKFTRMGAGATEGEITSIKASQIFGKPELYTALVNKLIEQNPYMTPESAAATAGYILRSGTNYEQMGSQNLKNIAADYMMGGWADTAAKGTLSAMGFNAMEMYGSAISGSTNLHLTESQQAERNRPLLSLYQSKLAELEAQGKLGEKEKAQYTAGMEFMAQIPGVQNIPGIGARGGKIVDWDKASKFIEKLGEIVNTPAGMAYAASMSAWDMAKRAGISAVMPNIANFDIGMTTEQSNIIQAQQMAFQQAYQTKAQGITNLAAREAYYGRTETAKDLVKGMRGMTGGEQDFVTRIMNNDPMAMAVLAQGLAKQRKSLGNLPGVQTIQGLTISADMLAMADMDNTGRLTGLSYGQTGIGWGGVSPKTAAGMIWGGTGGKYAQIAEKGYALGYDMDIGNGQKISEIGGIVGMQMAYNANMYNYQLQGFALQEQGIQQSWAHTQKQFGFQQQQFELSGWYQQQQFALQQEQINQSAANIAQSNAIQQRQMGLSRTWAREDWAYQDQVRNMQWGWRQEDYAEESRFMTGRQRRLAERGMKRETTMFNLEGDQIDKQRKRQEELWKLEDQRFALQKKQQAESLDMQQRQLDLQRRYFEESRKIQEAQMREERKYAKEQHDLQLQQLALQKMQAAEQREYQKDMELFAAFIQETGGQLNSLTEDGLGQLHTALENILDDITNIYNAANQYGDPLPALQSSNFNDPYSDSNLGGGTTNDRNHEETQFVPHGSAKWEQKMYESASYTNGTNIGGGYFLPMSNTENGKTVRQPINIYIGNEKIDSYVLDIVADELRA